MGLSVLTGQVSQVKVVYRFAGLVIEYNRGYGVSVILLNFLLYYVGLGIGIGIHDHTKVVVQFLSREKGKIWIVLFS